MEIFFSDESNRLTEEITGFMQKAAEEALIREFGTDPDAAELSVTIVDGEEIRQLNRDYRGIDRVTDVLSFPQFADREELEEALLGDSDVTLVGDVVICYDKAVSQAEEYGTGIVRELVYLFVHSVFHLFGYDHEDEEERSIMRSREEGVLEAIGVGR